MYLKNIHLTGCFRCLLVCLIWFFTFWFFTFHQQSFSYIEAGFPGLKQYKAWINVLAQGHNVVMTVRLGPAASRSRVKHSTTEPLRSRCYRCNTGIKSRVYWLNAILFTSSMKCDVTLLGQRHASNKHWNTFVLLLIKLILMVNIRLDR